MNYESIEMRADKNGNERFYGVNEEGKLKPVSADQIIADYGFDPEMARDAEVELPQHIVNPGPVENRLDAQTTAQEKLDAYHGRHKSFYC